MTKLFIIAGHGAGDPGAVGNGYQEAERVRALAQRIKDFGGNAVLLSDFERNYYKDNGISNLTISKDYKILELHMDSSESASAKGGHVIIYGEYKADKYDEKLAEFISSIFPGRSKTIVGRTDLANPKRAAKKGYNYRLLECGFISNADDIQTFNNGMDDIAKGILACFNIDVKDDKKPVEQKPTATQTVTQSLDAWAKEVIAGLHGNGHENRETSLKEAKCPYDYQTVRIRVNELLGVKTTTVSLYYPIYTGNSYGIDTVFRAIGVPEKFCGNYKNRKPIAIANGISDYQGTATQNTSLISLAKQGKLKRV